MVYNREFGRLYLKTIKIKIFDPDNVKYGYITYTADKGRMYNIAGIDEILKKTISDIEKNFPSLKYEVKYVGKGQYNFVCAGLRKTSISIAEI
jgi:hypothetical protein